jgi:hypothetical protein
MTRATYIACNSSWTEGVVTSPTAVPGITSLETESYVYIILYCTVLYCTVLLALCRLAGVEFRVELEMILLSINSKWVNLRVCHCDRMSSMLSSDSSVTKAQDRPIAITEHRRISNRRKPKSTMSHVGGNERYDFDCSAKTTETTTDTKQETVTENARQARVENRIQ